MRKINCVILPPPFDIWKPDRVVVRWNFIWMNHSNFFTSIDRRLPFRTEVIFVAEICQIGLRNIKLNHCHFGVRYYPNRPRKKSRKKETQRLRFWIYRVLFCHLEHLVEKMFLILKTRKVSFTNYVTAARDRGIRSMSDPLK